jgi:multidrug resistance protein MdtO
MALPVDDRRPGGRARELLTLLAPSSGRLEFATRQALICTLTTLVVQIYQTPDPALTVYLVFFLNRADRATSLVMNVVMLLLMSTVIALVIVTTMTVIDQPMWRVVSIATLSFGLLFLTSASKLRPIGAIVALIVGYALDLLGTYHAAEIATRALLYSWLFAAIPASVSMVVNLLIAPAPRRLVERALADRLRRSAAMLRSPDAVTHTAFDAHLREGPGEIPAWLKLAGAEKTSPTNDIAALRHAVESTTAIQLLVDLIAHDPEASLPLGLRQRVAHMLDETASILQSGGYPVEIAFDEDEGDAKLPAVPAALLADLREALIRFAEPSSPNPSAQSTAKAASGFFLPDAFTNPEHVQYALKTTAAAMFCYGLYSMLDWPSIHTCFITCYIVALSTTAETVEKLTLRILGCLLGAGAGIAAIVFVVPSLTSIGALMAVVFAGAFVAAWVAGGGPRIAYAGFQIAFAFFVCVIQGPAPAFDMVTARDRVIGILIGNLVSYLAFVHIWPVSVARRIDPAICALLRGLSALTSTVSLSGRRGLAAGTLMAHGAIERDLGLVPYEPRWIRPSPDWLQSRSQTLREVAALIGPLLLATDRNPELSANFTRRLDHLVDVLSPAGSSAPRASEQPTSATQEAEPMSMEGSTALWRLVDAPLAALEDALAQAAAPERTADHAQT